MTGGGDVGGGEVAGGVGGVGGGGGGVGGGRYSFTVSAESAAPPGAVFDLLCDAPGWSRWAGPMVRRSSWERGSGEPGSIRRLGAPPVTARERIEVSDRPSRHGYSQLSGIPMRRYRADVELTGRADGGTSLQWRASFDPAIPGSGPVLRAVLRRVVTGFARRVTTAAAPGDSR